MTAVTLLPDTLSPEAVGITTERLQPSLEPAADPPISPNLTLAARLLGRECDSQPGNLVRCSVGFVGLTLFAAASVFAFQLRQDWTAATELQWYSIVVRHALSQAIGVAVALVLSVPGVLILLRLLGNTLLVDNVLHATCREYARLGLLCAGYSPVVWLFAHTGGSNEFVVGMSIIGGVVMGSSVLVRLALSIRQSIERPTWLSTLTLVGWTIYTETLTLYVIYKFLPAAWH